MDAVSGYCDAIFIHVSRFLLPFCFFGRWAAHAAFGRETTRAEKRAGTEKKTKRSV